MNKKLFIVMLVLLAFFGCQQKSYKITGEATGEELDSTQVLLAERVNRVWQNIDSTYIVNGKFEFSGKVDSTRIISLMLVDKNSNIRVEPFVFEEGNILIKADSENIEITGTRQNDAFNIYKREEKELSDRINKEYEKFMALPDSLKTKAVEDSVDILLDEMIGEMKAKNLNYAMKSVNTLVGNYIFTNSFYNFTVEQKEALFAKMDEKTKSIPRIAELIAATEVEKKTSAGQPFVDLKMENPQGKPDSISNYVGKTDYLLIDFWASWCGPCIRTFPELTAFYAKNKGPKFDILGVSFDREKESWLEAIKKYNLTWPHISDIKYWDSQGAKLYAVNSIPATVLIDKSGKIVGRNMKLDEIQNLLNQ
ncbi:MAG: DUF4369 domain-containing protein [Porphyromonadaceae bacterium]|nr:DUF4369 domain-containing protein [Porphyromonadaceae bacterium]